jgi:sugar phosphate isomerase/epimerase
MIKSSVTVSLVPEACGGPFVFWDDLPSACRKARALGFDAVEVFAPGSQAVNPADLRRLLDDHGLRLAAVGTGAGWVVHRLSLTSLDAAQREQARQFVRSIIDMGAPFGAPAIIGSMQGRPGAGMDRDAALACLRDALDQLGDYAHQYGVPLLFEPLNRYETHLVNTISDGVNLLRTLDTTKIRLLADLFHMNIEEADVAQAIRDGAGHIGHLHFVDSNRRPAGCGHLDYLPIAAALREIDYDGYASAEALPYPNPDEAARLTIDAFRSVFASAPHSLPPNG